MLCISELNNPNMKKTILIILVSIFFLQCTSDDNVPLGDNVETASFSLFVDGTFFVPLSSGRLIISDSNGDILGDGDLSNNEETSLDVIIDPNAKYDATVFLKFSTNGIQLNLLYTYEDIVPGEYTLQALRGYNPNSDEITFTLTNSGANLELETTSTPLTLNYDPSNGGTHVLNGRLRASPGNYYASFKKNGEPLSRYIWNTSLSGDTNIEADYTSLPFVEGSSTIQLPANESIEVGISGVMDDDPLGVDGVRHRIQVTEYDAGETSLAAMFPLGVFDNLETTVQFNQPNSDKEFSFFQKSNNLPTVIPEPSLDITITDSSFSNFSATAEGEHDFFNLAFVYANAAQDETVIYEIYGKASPNITLSKVNLFNNLFENNPDITSNVLTTVKQFGITNYSQISSYNQFLQTPWLYGPIVLPGESRENVLLNFN